MPERIQRKRVAKWKVPKGAVYVGRPSRFGNPFNVKMLGRQRAVRLYQDWLKRYWNPTVLVDLSDDEYRSVAAARDSMKVDADIARFQLRGKDLMCWCPLDQPCHADVLLEIANA